MTYLFGLLLILGFSHFIFQNTIVPTLKTYQKNKLYSLRDRVILLICKSHDSHEKKVFEHILFSINNIIDGCENLTFSTLYEIRSAIKKNPNINNLISSHRRNFLKKGGVEAKKIDHELSEAVKDLILINAFAWIIYIAPIVVIIVLLKRINKAAKRIQRKIIILS